MDSWIDADELTTSTALSLIRANPGPYAKFYAMNVLEGLGRRQWGPMVLLVIVASALLARRSSVAVLVFVAGLVAVGNAMLVGLVQPTHVFRYTAYGDALVAASLLVAIFVATRASRGADEFSAVE